MGDDQDEVHPIDRKIHKILADIAHSTSDPALRHTALDLQLTLPSVQDWSAHQHGALAKRRCTLLKLLSPAANR
ncbi:hypothetical protein [Mycobacterium europaeum]|uniref:hypothetical protein n=1 Tax=Mycobacterium europaeum TaxID=761804 RepID=UPI0011531B65|nr:hypothetical protein [Mycobacterium europaeum]